MDGIKVFITAKCAKYSLYRLFGDKGIRINLQSKIDQIISESPITSNGKITSAGREDIETKDPTRWV